MTEKIAELRRKEARATKVALLSDYCPPLIAEARMRQDEILTERFRGKPYRIADLGCGDGYHGLIFGPASIAYHGFEISAELADIARSSWKQAGLVQAELRFGDLAKADPPDEFYDLVYCLYFTPGNFRDVSDDLALYTDAYLDRNPVFMRIMSTFYRALKTGGRMFLTVYRDVPEAEAAQRDFYQKTGQHMRTPRGSRFVATRESFWSVRFTRRSMLSNLAGSGISANDVLFHELNAIAWLIEIAK